MKNNKGNSARFVTVLIVIIAISLVIIFLWYQKNITESIPTNINNVNSVVEQLPKFGVAVETDRGIFELSTDSKVLIMSSDLQPIFHFGINESVDLKDILITIGDNKDILNDPFIEGITQKNNEILVQFDSLLFPTEYTIEFGEKSNELKTYNFSLKIIDEFNYNGISNSQFWYLIDKSRKFGNWGITDEHLLSSPLDKDKARGYSSLPFLLRFGNNVEIEFNFIPGQQSSELGFYFYEQKVTVVLGRENNNIQLIQDNLINKTANYNFEESKSYRINIQKRDNRYTLSIKKTDEDTFITVLDYMSESEKVVQYNTIGFVQWPGSGGTVEIDNFTVFGEEGGGS